MAFDFPASPTQGQQFSPSAGVTYVYNGYAWDLLSGPASMPMKITQLVGPSTSGTYNVTPGTIALDVEMVGCGGGGAGGGGATSGGNVTFGPLTAFGGVGGALANTGGAGGGASGGDLGIQGGAGGGGSSWGSGAIGLAGGIGGSSFFGGGGAGGGAGGPGAAGGANSGGGGGGGGGNGASSSGAGGGAGGYCRKLFVNPAASYSWTIGVVGAAGGAASGVFAGGAGASGTIIVAEYGGGVSTAVTVPNIRTITASGIYTPSPGLVAAIVECVGGGAGGGGASAAANTSFCGGGGGSGGYSRRALTAAQIGASQSITIGAGGAASAAGGSSNGGNGGVTSFGSLCIANGGAGGTGSYSGATPTAGAGAIISGAVGDFVAAGANGGPGFWNGINANVVTVNGWGAPGPFGGGARSALGADGQSSAPYGAGGAGGYAHNAAANQAGSAGFAGVCIVTEFIQQGGAAAAALPGAKVLIQSQTVSAAVANVAFTSGLDATYDEYEFHIYNFTPVTDGSGLIVNFSFDGGATWKTDANYAYTYRVQPVTGAASDQAFAAQSTIWIGPGQAAGSSAVYAAILRLWLPTGSSFKGFMSDAKGYNASMGPWRCEGTNWYTGSSAPLSGIRFQASAGNIASGTFNLYGIKK